MKLSKETIIFIGIVLLGLILRLFCLGNPSGMWHDEIVMYNQASASFPFGIIKETLKGDIHFPLYQLLLAIWMKVFSNNDIVVRSFSILMGVLTVIFAFFAGQEAKDKKLGNIFAFLTAINVTLVYYSQEVKFYSMLSMLSVLALWFLFRITNKNNISSYVGYILANAAIVYTFTIGIFYVLAELIVFAIYAFLKDRNILKKFVISNLFLFLLICPFIYYILAHIGHYESPAWTYVNNFFTPLVVIQNYFSPMLIGVYDNPVFYIPAINLITVIFIFLPVFLAFAGIYNAIKDDNDDLLLLFIPLIFLLLEVILTYNSGLRIMTRYTILALMPLLMLVSKGFYALKSKSLKLIIGYLFLVYIFAHLNWPVNSMSGWRRLGPKPAVDIIMRNKIQKNDILILPYRKNDFDKYLIFDGKKYSMQYFLYKNYAFDSNKSDKYKSFKKYIFDTDNINTGYEKFFLNTVIKPMASGSRIFIVWNNDLNIFPFHDEANYYKYPVLSLALSRIYPDTDKICRKYLKYKKTYQLEFSKILIFEK